MTLRRNCRLVVVGGGVAGVAAALEAARAGLETCLVEQRSALRAPQALLAELAVSGADVLLETAAWGIWGRDLALCESPAQSSVLTFEQLIIATGSFERPVAFPGSTLPGVITLDGMLEHADALGERVVVAGYGPFLGTAARILESDGVHVAAVLDASAREGQLPVRAEGDEHLERLVTARVDADWRVLPGTEATLDSDTLVLAFGFLPEDGLARLAGCQLSGSPFVDPSTARDAWMRTSVDGVLVAGDAGGIAGPESAIDQGRLAGLAAAVDAGCIGADEAQHRADPIQRGLSQAARPELPRDGLFALAGENTVICRCENVTAAEITARLFEGSIEPAGVIAETRATMGMCQGRNCASLVAAAIARHLRVGLDRIPPITPRPPVMPVPLGVLAERPPVFARVTH